MPIFEYKCGKCGVVTEFLVSGNGKKKHVCPECGSSDMVKQFSSFAVGVKQPGMSKKCHGCTDMGCPSAGGR